MPREYFHVNDFRGGMNVDVGPELLADNELVIADNCTLDQLGPIAKRKGTAVLNKDSYDCSVTQVFEWRMSSGNVKLMAVLHVNGEQHTLFDVSENGTLTAVQTVASSKVGHCAINYGGNDLLYFVDGAELYQYNGTTCEAVTPNAAADNDLTPIRKCKWLVYNPRSYRIYAAGNPDAASSLYYSEPNDISYFKNTSFLVPSGNDGPVTALAVFSHALLVFYSDSIRVWKGTTPADATWTALPAPYGTSAPDTVCLTPNSLTWLSRGGIVCLSPALLDYNLTMLPGEELIRDISRGKVSSLIRNIDSHANCCAAYDTLNKRYLLAYNEGDQRHVLVYEWDLQAYTRYTGIIVNNWCVRKNGTIVFGSNNYIMQLDAAGYNDVNVTTGEAKPIQLTIGTKWNNFGKPMIKKRLRKILVAGHSDGTADSYLDLSIRSVGLEYERLGSIRFITEGMVWGDPWGTPWPISEMKTIEVRTNAKGERFQLIVINNDEAAATKVYGLLYEFTTKHKPKGEKAYG